MNRQEILTVAEELVNGPRAEDYGDAAENFQRVADLWSPIFGQEVTKAQVVQAMIGLKLSRLINSPEHTDTWIDIAGYAALGGEIYDLERKKSD